MSVTPEEFSKFQGAIDLKKLIERVADERFEANMINPRWGTKPFATNKIINGDGRVWQRAASASTSVPNRTFSVDKFAVTTNTGGTIFTDRENGTGNPKYWIRAGMSAAGSVSSSDHYTALMHQVEGIEMVDTRYGTSDALPMTLSFLFKTHTAGKYCVALRNYATTRSCLLTFDHPGGWASKRVILFVPPCTDATWEFGSNPSLDIWWSLGAGSTYTTSTVGSWISGNYINASGCVTTSNQTTSSIAISEVKLEIGTAMTPYVAPSFSEQLLQCQRYFQLYGGNTDNWEMFAPVWTTFNGGGTAGASTGSGIFLLRPRMRVAPSFSVPAGAGNLAIFVSGSGYALTAIAAGPDGLSQDAYRFDFNFTGAFAAGTPGVLRRNGTSAVTLQFAAEI